MDMNDIEPQVADILHGHSAIAVQHFPAFWRVQATHGSTSHSATGDDPLQLARHIARLSERAQPVSNVPSPPTHPESDADQAADVDVLAPASPSASAADPSPQVDEPPSLDAMLAAGTMLVEDEIAIRRQRLASAIPAYSIARIEAAYDSTRRMDISARIQTVINKLALGLPVNEAEQAAYDDAVLADRWIKATTRHAEVLVQTLQHCTLDMLRAYDLDNAEWPIHGNS